MIPPGAIFDLKLKIIKVKVCRIPRYAIRTIALWVYRSKCKLNSGISCRKNTRCITCVCILPSEVAIGSIYLGLDMLHRKITTRTNTLTWRMHYNNMKRNGYRILNRPELAICQVPSLLDSIFVPWQ